MNERVLDVRCAAEFEALHRAGAVNIPLEELAGRAHELPPRDEPVTIYDADRARASAAASMLVERGRQVADVRCDPAWLHADPTQKGPSRARLWRPHRWLERSVDLLRERWTDLRGQRAIDLACGTGRDAVFLAMQGFAVEAVDVLPDALERAEDLARRCGVSIRTRAVDLEGASSLEAGAYDLVAVFNFLHRPLLPVLPTLLRPGGCLIYETFLAEQRARYGKPVSDAHLLGPGELRTAFGTLDVVRYREGCAGPQRIAAAIMAYQTS
ncbi:MAG: methyltransferase domain-containing protein [Phycisphaerae bacterium]|nr:methyltransferase domain-containing protein [Phycisphaerae bacterium]